MLNQRAPIGMYPDESKSTLKRPRLTIAIITVWWQCLARSSGFLSRSLGGVVVQSTIYIRPKLGPPQRQLSTVWSPKGRLWSSGWEAHQKKIPMDSHVSVICEPNTSRMKVYQSSFSVYQFFAGCVSWTIFLKMSLVGLCYSHDAVDGVGSLDTCCK
jgi:hypothetical protein